MLAEAHGHPDRHRVRSPEAGIGRAAVRGAIIGYVTVLMIVGGIVFAATAELGVALAVGAFVAIWGGPGWGGMVAAQVHADRLSDEERKVRPPPG